LTFIVTTSPVISAESVSVSACDSAGGCLIANLIVMPLPSFTLSLNPPVVEQGQCSSGTITLAEPAPSGGAVFQLQPLNPVDLKGNPVLFTGLGVFILPTFTIPGGSTTGSFQIITHQPTSPNAPILVPIRAIELPFFAPPAIGLTQQVDVTVLPPTHANDCLSPVITLVDPVPSLVNDGAVIADIGLLTTQGNMVRGVAADGVTQVVIRIAGAPANDSLTLTLDQDGELADVISPNFQPSVSVHADSAGNAFALYRAPVDFVRADYANDLTATSRTVHLTVQSSTDPNVTSDTPITIVRPPVILVHGIWSNTGAWNYFTPLINDSRFTVARVNYDFDASGTITSTTPPYKSNILQQATTSSFGFAYTTPFVFDQIKLYIGLFKDGGNTLGVQVAAAQADVVAHSMGGALSRSLVLQSDFLSDLNFRQGTIHKLITINTPHLGTPLATQLLGLTNDCVRNLLASKGNIAFESVTTSSGTFNGAVFDLAGDGTGGSVSSELSRLRQAGPHPIPTALIAGVMTQNNLNGLTSSPAANYISARCAGDPLAASLNPADWNDVFFGQANDGIVPLQSELNGLSGFTAPGFVHSSGTEKLGFNGPDVLIESQPIDIPSTIIGFLNTAISNISIFKSLAP
jgi:pimeloyl-ACP methyl ester carboxylesterase